MCHIFYLIIIEGIMGSSGDHLAVMRPAYMSLPSPNITCPEEEQSRQMEVRKYRLNRYIKCNNMSNFNMNFSQNLASNQDSANHHHPPAQK